ncbi:MAG: acetylornithine carbamoyltransferase, partial [Flavobacteriaceae bacterium]|nr:acetylornithine carbamoyltransferase [Flavobacteriaceae bacterium]
MKQYLNLNDIANLDEIITEAIQIKKNPFGHKGLGKNKTMVLLFFNSSLRTRLSTEKAARNLGMDVILLNVNDVWNIEFEDGTLMNAGSSEHIKEAAQVISQYVDVIGVRAFPSLRDKQKDESEHILNSFKKYASVPIVNMESATSHPLQALADAITIKEISNKPNPKVVLSWAPHPKALPHAVANSFVEMMQNLEVDFSITHPEGYELSPNITGKTPIIYNQTEALRQADFVYVKNWSNYNDYGRILNTDSSWMMTMEKLGSAKFM